jgi:hypothetical protein
MTNPSSEPAPLSASLFSSARNRRAGSEPGSISKRLNLAICVMRFNGAENLSPYSPGLARLFAPLDFIEEGAPQFLGRRGQPKALGRLRQRPQKLPGGDQPEPR